MPRSCGPRSTCFGGARPWRCSRPVGPRAGSRDHALVFSSPPRRHAALPRRARCRPCLHYLPLMDGRPFPGYCLLSALVAQFSEHRRQFDHRLLRAGLPAHRRLWRAGHRHALAARRRRPRSPLVAMAVLHSPRGRHCFVVPLPRRRAPGGRALLLRRPRRLPPCGNGRSIPQTHPLSALRSVGATGGPGAAYARSVPTMRGESAWPTTR